MSAKSKIFLATVMVMVFIALLSWKYWPTEDDQPVGLASKTAPSQTSSKLISATNIEAPKALPALPQASSASPPLSSADPHTDLQILIPKLADLLAARDFANYLKMAWSSDKLDYELRYASAPTVEKLAEQFFPTTGEHSDVAERKTSSLAGALRSIQNQSPVFGVDDTGAPTATYKIDYSAYGRYTVQFKQVNGLWYCVDWF